MCRTAVFITFRHSLAPEQWETRKANFLLGLRSCEWACCPQLQCGSNLDTEDGGCLSLRNDYEYLQRCTLRNTLPLIFSTVIAFGLGKFHTRWTKRRYPVYSIYYSTTVYLLLTHPIFILDLIEEDFSNTNTNNYLLTPWSRFLLYKLTGLQLVKKFPAFYGTRRFITVVTSARHLSLC